MTKYKDLYVAKGTDFSTQIRLTHESNSANVNIAGSSFTSKARKGLLTSSIAANLTIDIISTANGTINVSLSSANTSNLENGRYVYDIFQTFSNTTIKIYEGQMIVTQGVST